MDRVVRVQSDRNQELGIDDRHVSMDDVFRCDRIHVVNMGVLEYVMTRNAQVTAIIAPKDERSSFMPLV